MSTLETELRAELDGMASAGTLKRIPVLTSPQGPVVDASRVAARSLVLCSNNYLGLANHPEVVAAGIDGLGSTAPAPPRSGSSAARFDRHCEIERDIADFVGTAGGAHLRLCWNANEALLDTLCDTRH